MQTGNHYLTVAKILKILKEDTIYENIVKRGTFVGNTVKMVPVFFFFFFFYFEHTV